MDKTKDNLILKTIIFTSLVIFVVASIFSFFKESKQASASAPSGLPATVATTTSETLVARTARTLFATSTCSARVITTRVSPVMLTFSDYNGATPTGTFGHLQAASTTVVYDSGVYGCGLVKVYSDVADTITATETR